MSGGIGLAKVIAPRTLLSSIKFGATVRLGDEDTDTEKTWQIVGEQEANSRGFKDSCFRETCEKHFKGLCRARSTIALLY